jgi:hypothetical protein
MMMGLVCEMARLNSGTPVSDAQWKDRFIQGATDKH